MTLPELLSCPFCGADAEYWKATVVRCVMCTSCHIATKYTTWEEAAQMWNKRVGKKKTGPEIFADDMNRLLFEALEGKI